MALNNIMTFLLWISLRKKNLNNNFPVPNII